MNEIFTASAPDYKLLSFGDQKIGLFHNVSKFLGEKIFHDIQNEKKMKWIEDPIKKIDNQTTTEFFGEIVDKNIKNKTLGLMTDILPSRRIFQKEMGYPMFSKEMIQPTTEDSPLAWFGPKFIKVLPSIKIHNYELGITSSDETYSFIYFFNDDYKGGKIFFPECNELFQPKKNDLIILPKNYSTYMINPITQGIQYVMAASVTINK
jgi:hypothetical protein